MAKPRLWKPNSFKPLRDASGKRDKAERFVVTRGKNAGAIVSKAERIRRVFGLHPEKLTAERKAGLRPYVSAATEAQARAQSATREKRREQLALNQYHRAPTNPIPYLNTNGETAHDYFSGRNLMTMHLYRDAYERAIFTGDGTDLKRFKHATIITYTGPGLSNYHNKGVQIYPETNLKKILAHRERIGPRERARFDADRNYRRLEVAA